MWSLKFFLPLLLLANNANCLAAPTAEDQAAEDKVVIELISRLEEFDLEEASQKVKDSVGRYLKNSSGSEQYFAFVERFNVRGEVGSLLEMAAAKPASAEGGTALRVLVKFGETAAIQQRITTLDPPNVAPFLNSLGNVGSKEAAGLLLQIALSKSAAEICQSAVAALGQSRGGENALLAAVKEKNLPDALIFAAGTVLHASRDEAIRTEAAALIAMPATADNKPLPPIAELVKRTGEAAKGEAIYQRACLTCHKIGDTGIDFGPALTEIGGKLAPEALYAAILDPSAAISFGYEGHEITTTGGDVFIGLISGETDAEISLRLLGGIVQKIPKGEVASRAKLPGSLMTPNLQTTMTEEEFVNLVAYLGTLKKK